MHIRNEATSMQLRTAPRWRLAALCLILFSTSLAGAQNSLPPEMAEKVDRLASDTLAKFQTPGATLAIVQHGKLTYAKAYGKSRLEPATVAQPEMRWLIGSISKQFTAVAVLLLQEDGKLSLDDRVSKYFPDLTRADEISLRQILSHTAGYSDCWPEDYSPPAFKKQSTPRHILDKWAKRPLDFEPGTRWQYSNTGYSIAGLIVEKVSGKGLFEFMKERIFQPLGMTSVFDINTADLPTKDAVGHTSYALGPPRLSPVCGVGWPLGWGQLAMTGHDLALWDIAQIEQKILKPASWAQMQHEIILKDSKECGYGLGVFVRHSDGHRQIQHDGEMPGFIAYNLVEPDEGLAVLVLCNSDTTEAPSMLGGGVISLLANKPATPPSPRPPLPPASDPAVGQILAALTSGKIDRTRFSDDCNDYFTDMVLRDFASSLTPLGAPTAILEGGQEERGGLVFRSYLAQYPGHAVRVSTFKRPDGKFQQFMVLRVPE